MQTKTIGIILAVIGLIMMIYTGFTYVTTEKVVDLGPLEVNKAFAIASRSYALVKYLEGAKSKKPYHIKNTNVHQTYNGFHTNPVLIQAVKETSGVILTYDKKPILAMFDCCCGDVIPCLLYTSPSPRD